MDGCALYRKCITPDVACVQEIKRFGGGGIGMMRLFIMGEEQIVFICRATGVLLS